MINMFVGDSHSRQFVGASYGIFCHYVFSGATVKGLANSVSKTGHAKLIKEAVATEQEKTVFLMFGSVDLDFSLQREFCLKEEVDVEKFLTDRIDTYHAFIQSLLDAGRKSGVIKKLIVICPQVSPLVSDNFFVQTPKHIRLDPALLKKAAQRFDISDEARARRVILFNDALHGKVSDLREVSTIRIDRQMVDENYRILGNFIPKSPIEHHAVLSQTQKLWGPILNEYITDHIIVG
ncbi:hypothetical protein [Pararhizobium gei]|uniref:hypothetical protein n=1 Tax=Pararhizobium gei TaxID=1395951 RepID=UPI0023DA0E66|nr:hypothetical protein [Rhizobium gei]